MIEFCDGLFSINLAGLKEKDNFRLSKLIGKQVEVKIKCANQDTIINGRLVRVATDFIEIDSNGKKITILHENIKSVS